MSLIYSYYISLIFNHTTIFWFTITSFHPDIVISMNFFFTYENCIFPLIIHANNKFQLQKSCNLILNCQTCTWIKKDNSNILYWSGLWKRSQVCVFTIISWCVFIVFRNNKLLILWEKKLKTHTVLSCLPQEIVKNNFLAK